MTAYWHASGDVHTHGQIVTLEDAAAIWDLYADECTAALVAKDFEAAGQAYALMMQLEFAAKRATRHRAGLPMHNKALHHLDGDPMNNDLANLSIVDLAQDRRRKP
jgi:phage-related tail fiber protein